MLLQAGRNAGESQLVEEGQEHGRLPPFRAWKWTKWTVRDVPNAAACRGVGREGNSVGANGSVMACHRR
ncbi:hypothetical protein WR25_02001 [Diploscapter pachys]|uniref:Uncharacterized protein n=1 Tax=Diploscapter pachys TaxID=2018661 RepID=A0A2A2M4R7_9BILA|nr:hypothetical protein WR25_02001 [Diploscapter pachys]